LCKNFSEMTAETVKIVLNVDKSKYAAFLDMLKLLEFVSVEPSQSAEEEEGVAGYEADGTSVTDEELIASALEALEDKKHGRVVSLRDFKVQSGME
jgi:hypothetical protein